MTKEDFDFINKNSNKKFEFCKLSVSSKNVSSEKEIEEAIRNFSPVDGWISLQSTSAFRVKDSSFDTKGEHILAGEFINAQNISLSVRFTGDEWLCITSCENDDGEELVKSSSKQLSKLGEKVFLNYDVYYKSEKELGFRPYVSAFTGFSEGK